MTGGPNEGCQRCGSLRLTTERIVEHDCGHVGPITVFEEGECPKCGHAEPLGDLNAVNSVCRCLECGRRFELEGETEETPATNRRIQFPDLPTPTPGGELSWIPDRYRPNTERGQQLMVSALVIAILLAGIAGTVSVSTILDSESSDHQSVDRSWETHETIVIFRNDDIQPWYNQEEMRAVDQVFIDEEVPVTLGIIPKVAGENAITDDDETCSYLRSLESEYPDQFEMAIHGYTHEEQTDFYNGSEFGNVSITTQHEWLVAGEEIMHDCVDRPSQTFIPPMNTYDDNTVEVLVEEGYPIVSGGEWFTSAYYKEEAPFVKDGITHVPETQAFEDWSNADNDSDEVPFHDLETLTDSFDEAVEDNEPYVQMLHYQYFTSEDQLEMLRSLIEHMNATDDVTFMTLEQFGDGLESGDIEETDDGWRVLEPIEETVSETADDDSSQSITPNPWTEIRSVLF
ncbi:hypothetical protein SAMN04487967_2744 [Natronorubrum sediminis]|uniref:DUF2334 domain-containing protein n=2 Tax=Natronorubrum sediminis TaxID=640943 RepID=A0A1H6G0N2_9EURY|nr:hypothetical protein SAMN04487967_2744 [Natronorubrum sediminis]